MKTRSFESVVSFSDIADLLNEDTVDSISDAHTWGDTHATLITWDQFTDHLTDEEVEKVKEKMVFHLIEPKSVFIDLES